ncbi:BgTH12-05771 [Blumeria graminis f. sp. triticale]|uniref:Condensin complex subunit 2 n=1 Tax=Blumeria graminis f. sp. triticale TaxID=1689686 RepID=A0A9W4D4P3_BLUGR|nr:BgTH12-05771 [Blumeria graminis f. sp. triticale]
MARLTHRHRRGASGSLTTSPLKSPLKIPLNDDVQEKAKRLQSRYAMQDIQMNQIKAAASPIRKHANLEQAISSPPRTKPKTPRRSSDEKDPDDELFKVVGNAVTPMKRVPILANFEEWMKMATDNKINATNSWNFALIDYFHDLSLLKEGDGVNFQKASCTLDGCVKIYTSRVDSVATETGKLLSGLADSSKLKKKNIESLDGEESNDDIEDDDGGARKRSKKRAQRSSDVTLATSFASLQLVKVELEFSVDPLFKKASADFDEGGAKGLLLNHLSIDGKGRVVFDSSDDAEDITSASSANDTGSNGPDVNEESQCHSISKTLCCDGKSEGDDDIDILSLGARFFPNLKTLDDQDICPSLKNYLLSDFSSLMNIPNLKAPEDWRQDKDSLATNEGTNNQSDLIDENQNKVSDDDDDDGLIQGVDVMNSIGFGEGGEAWARDTFISTSGGDHEADDRDDAVIENYPSLKDQSRNMRQHDYHEIFNYFDGALHKSWAGPEHWRIRKIKDNMKPTTVRARKEKEPFLIEFSTLVNGKIDDALYVQASSTSAISLPKKEWKSKSKNLLPDDKHFNSKQLLRLFLKPNAHIRLGGKGFHCNQAVGAFRAPEDGSSIGNMDEAFWAQKNEAVEDDSTTRGNYDAEFFQDDGLSSPVQMDDTDFANITENLSSETGKVIDRVEGERSDNLSGALASAGTAGENEAFSNQIVVQSRRSRPEYVQFARVAKKVDVRRLKEELWKGIGYDNAENKLKPTVEDDQNGGMQSLKFTTIINNLHKVYPKQIMNDISTSYCFICLLHLANEKGLIISEQQDLTDLEIAKDRSA